jgi:hypothetical protein
MLWAANGAFSTFSHFIKVAEDGLVHADGMLEKQFHSLDGTLGRQNWSSERF